MVMLILVVLMELLNTENGLILIHVISATVFRVITWERLCKYFRTYISDFGEQYRLCVLLKFF